MEVTAIKTKATKAASTSKSVCYKDDEVNEGDDKDDKEEEDVDEEKDSSMEVYLEPSLTSNTIFTIDEQL